MVRTILHLVSVHAVPSIRRADPRRAGRGNPAWGSARIGDKGVAVRVGSLLPYVYALT